MTPRSRRTSRPAAPLLESLEPRTLLSSAPVIVGGSTGGTLVLTNPSFGAGNPSLVTNTGFITTFTTLTATVRNNLTVALVARVQSAEATNLPTGTVTFHTTNGAILATLPVNPAVTSTSNPALGQVSVALPLSLITAGSHTIIASYNGDAFHAPSASNSVVLTNVARRIVAVGSPAGASSSVTVFDTATGLVLRRFDPFPGFSGGVHVAVGDVNGDGIPDVIAAPAASGTPFVRVFDLATGTAIRNFFAFDTGFRGGLSIALADINNDGAQDILVGAGPGGGPHVKVFNGRNNLLIASFFAYDAAFRGGVNVAGGEVTGDGLADIITAPASNGGPQIKVFSGTGAGLERSFFGFTSSFRGGMTVGVTDYNQDGVGDIVTAPGRGAIPQVQIFPTGSNAPIGAFIAGSQFATAGLNLSTFDYDGDGVPDIVVGSAAGAFRPLVFSGLTRQQIGGLFPFGLLLPNASFLGGFGG
jgi:hypothetical protein